MTRPPSPRFPRRAGFQELDTYARPGDTLTVSELYRLCRDLQDILAVRTWCHDHGVKLRVLSGALSGITDLAGIDATTTMLVNVLVPVGQFQRDLQNELTREGLAAAWAKGNKSGRRPQVARLGVIDDVRQAYCTGTSIAALARHHGVSRGAIRTAVADLLPNQPDKPTATTEPDTVTVEMPGKIATPSRPRRPGRSTAARTHDPTRPGLQPPRHRHTRDPPRAAARRGPLNTEGASSANRKAYRIYWERLNSAINRSPRSLSAGLTAGQHTDPTAQRR